MELKRKIESEYGSVYRFCKATGVAKSLVYQVLKGTYPGNIERQTARLLEYLGENKKELKIERIYKILKNVACSKCPDKNSPGPRCRGCLSLFKEQALALIKYLEE